MVKIEPKAIGVGQYQHDKPQKELEQALDAVVHSYLLIHKLQMSPLQPRL